MTTPRWWRGPRRRTRSPAPSIDGLPGRARWHERLVALMQLPVVLEAARRGEHLFTVERPSGAEQFRLARAGPPSPARSRRRRSPIRVPPPPTPPMPSTGSRPRVDGSLVAIGTSEGGTERSTLRVISGMDGSPAGTADDEIPDTRACSVAWEPDGSGFFYTRYPEGDEYHRTVHHHRLGTPWASDPVVWAEHPDPQAWPQVTLSQDGRWLLVEVTCGWSRTDVHVFDRVGRHLDHARRGRRGADRAALRRRAARHSSGSPTSTRRVAEWCGSRSTTKRWPLGPRRGRRSCPSATTSSPRSASRVTGCSWSRAAPRSTRCGTSTPTARRRRAVDGLGPAVAIAGLVDRPPCARRVRARGLVRRHRPRRGGSLATTTVRPSHGAMPPRHPPRSPASSPSRRRRTARSTAPRSGCSSSTAPTSRRRRRRRRSSTATADSRSRSHRCSSPTPQRGARPAGSVRRRRPARRLGAR